MKFCWQIMNQSSRCALFVALSIIIFMSMNVSFALAENFQDVRLTSQTGESDTLQLIYVRSQEIYASKNRFEPIQFEHYIRAAKLSPQRTHIAALMQITGTTFTQLTILNLDGIALTTFVFKENIEDFYWLNDEEILSIFVPIGMWPPKFYPYSISNIATNFTQSVAPIEITGRGSDIEPFISSLHDFDLPLYVSLDGRSILVEDRNTTLLYDTSTRELIQSFDQNQIWGFSFAWSSVVHNFVFLGRPENGHYPIYLYESSSQEVSLVTTIPTEEDSYVTWNPESLSPNNTYLAVGINGDKFGELGLGIVNLPTGEVIQPSLTNYFNDRSYSLFDFAWSPDSRFLAVYGQVRAELPAQAASIFVYDMNTEQVSMVASRGRIVGWIDGE